MRARSARMPQPMTQVFCGFEVSQLSSSSRALATVVIEPSAGLATAQHVRCLYRHLRWSGSFDLQSLKLAVLRKPTRPEHDTPVILCFNYSVVYVREAVRVAFQKALVNAESRNSAFYFFKGAQTATETIQKALQECGVLADKKAEQNLCQTNGGSASGSEHT